MGRTIPSYRIILEEELKRSERFRDALRIEERTTFKDLMDKCRPNASAAGVTCFPVKTEGCSSPFYSRTTEASRNCEKTWTRPTTSPMSQTEEQD